MSLGKISQVVGPVVDVAFSVGDIHSFLHDALPISCSKVGLYRTRDRKSVV